MFLLPKVTLFQFCYTWLWAQIIRIHYEKAFAPIACPSSIKTIMANWAENNLDVYQIDFVTT